jgi:hypothetical protein
VCNVHSSVQKQLFALRRLLITASGNQKTRSNLISDSGFPAVSYHGVRAGF